MGDMVRLGRRVPTAGRASRGAVVARELDYRGFFEATYPRLVRTLWFVVHDPDLAEEIAQEAFIVLHLQWPKVRSYDRPDLWVRRVALRKAQREATRAIRRVRAERDAALPDIVDLELPDPALREAIASLPARQRAVVVLFYLEDRPMEEVADLVGCTTATGFVHLHRARRRLAQLLTETVGQEVDDDVH